MKVSMCNVPVLLSIFYIERLHVLQSIDQKCYTDFATTHDPRLLFSHEKMSLDHHTSRFSGNVNNTSIFLRREILLAHDD